MHRLETESRRGRARRSKGGTALVSTLVVFTGVFGLLYATSLVSIEEASEARDSIDQVRAEALAEAGAERGMNFLALAVEKTEGVDPIDGLVQLFDGNGVFTPYTGETLTAAGTKIGEYSVTMRLLDAQVDEVTIAIDATGYLPAAPQNLPEGTRVQEWKAVSTTVRYSLTPSQVFDYAYFINNWGWFYGNTIVCNGNARSNGQFDAAGYSPTVSGQPIYDDVVWNGTTATLIGYQDDNLDGLEDGNDGGVFSGWDIVGAENLQGVGGNPQNQHDFDGYVGMPNLSNLGSYEASAKQESGSISIGGMQVSNAVWGDEGGEKQNLFLYGTPSDPIELNGKVVVRGDVIIFGTVTGQGAIYAGGNIYVPDSVTYLDPPTSERPADNTQAATEAWLSANWNKDFLGLFAAENVVVGDHTDSDWRSYVGGWMSHSLNASAEDAGIDNIPNTRAGLDGILGTADDDVLEGDGVFTVQTYTQQDADLGLIPAGFSVGDPIPGTGEDIDGDGQYDGTTTLADIDFDSSLTTSEWGGNMPPGGISKYSDIATLTATHLDATFYTNHTFAYVVVGSETAKINGALVSRNEDIIYGTPTIEINYDARLLGGRSGLAGGLLPHLTEAPEIVSWRVLDRDPNRYTVAP